MRIKFMHSTWYGMPYFESVIVSTKYFKNTVTYASVSRSFLIAIIEIWQALS